MTTGGAVYLGAVWDAYSMEPSNRSPDAATNLRTNNTQAIRTTTFFPKCGDEIKSRNTADLPEHGNPISPRIAEKRCLTRGLACDMYTLVPATWDLVLGKNQAPCRGNKHETVRHGVLVACSIL